MKFDHRFSYIVAGLILAYALALRLLGEHYASEFLDLGAGIFVVLGLFFQIAKPRRQLPAAPVKPRPMPSVTIPSSPVDLHCGITMVHRHFSNEKPKSLLSLIRRKSTPLISADVMAEAFRKNPYSGFSINDGEGTVRGLFEMWAIRSERLASLMAGSITEADLGVEDFLAYQPNLKQFYVAVTIPPLDSDKDRSFYESSLLYCALQGAAVLLENAYLEPRTDGDSAVELYGIEASVEGGALMEDLGFVRNASLNRSDHKTVYSVVAGQQYLYDLKTRLKISKARYPVHFRPSVA